MDQCSKYFVEEPQDYLLCSICLGVFEKPVLLHCCGQTLCHKCVLECQKSSSVRFSGKKCPMCRKQGTMTYTTNVTLEDVIQQYTQISCTNNNKDGKNNEIESPDSSWVGKLLERTVHAINKNIKIESPHSHAINVVVVVIYISFSLNALACM